MSGDIVPFPPDGIDRGPHVVDRALPINEFNKLLRDQVPEACRLLDEASCGTKKPHMVACCVCKGWLEAGTLGPKGCPHCKGAMV